MNCRQSWTNLPSTLVEVLQYCSNVQHLSLPSTKLDPEQLHHMRFLETLEIKVDNDSDIKQLFSVTGGLRELTMFSCFSIFNYLITQFLKLEMRPSLFNIITSIPFKKFNNFDIKCLIGSATEATTISTGTTTTFRVYNSCDKVPIKFSPTLPYFQLQIEGSGQVTTPCVQLNDFGIILGLDNGVAMMTDCQYGGRTMCMVRYQPDIDILSKLNSIHVTRCDNFSCVTHFDLSNYRYSFHSGHLEQVALACPNLQIMNLQNCLRCLKSLQGLQAIASHCQNLQGLNLLSVHVSLVEDHMKY